MKIIFANGMKKRIKVGDALPFGNPLVKVEWTQDDILPDPKKFQTYMSQTIQVALVQNGSASILFSAEIQR